MFKYFLFIYLIVWCEIYKYLIVIYLIMKYKIFNNKNIYISITVDAQTKRETSTSLAAPSGYINCRRGTSHSLVAFYNIIIISSFRHGNVTVPSVKNNLTRIIKSIYLKVKKKNKETVLPVVFLPLLWTNLWIHFSFNNTDSWQSYQNGLLITFLFIQYYIIWWRNWPKKQKEDEID